MHGTKLTMSLLLAHAAAAQTPIPLPAHGVSIAGNGGSGMWYVSPPLPHRITGIRVPNEANQPWQAVEIIDFGTTPPPLQPSSVVGTTLFFDNTRPSGVVIPCDITVPANRVIGVFGVGTELQGGGRTWHSLGRPASPFVSSILGHAVTLTSLGENYPTTHTGPKFPAVGGAPMSSHPTNSITRVELYVAPANGLYANFSADVTGGTSPLTVQFTDRTYTPAPGGVLTWAWDFDGDSVIDSTQQNPSFTYSTCGTYDVTLTVTDAAHPANSLTRNAYIATDRVVPGFTTALVAPNGMAFTDTSVPTPTSWAWDLDGDNIVDSTLQNPVWTYPTACTSVNVTLTTHRQCSGPHTLTRQVVTLRRTATCSDMTGGTSAALSRPVGSLFDLVVNNPEGISVCGVTGTPISAGQFFCDVYVTQGSYVGNHLNASVWRLVGTGTGIASAGSHLVQVPAFVPMAQPFYLAPGSYGMAVYYRRPVPLTQNNIAYTAGALGPFGNADVTFLPDPSAGGMVLTDLFSGLVLWPRVWNGMLHYTTTSATGDAGYGFFGSGCAGSLGVPGNTCPTLPRLGQTMTVTLSRLAVNAAFFLIGFSRTNSPLGPLPLDLTPLGAPGCFGRVSNDSIQLLFGAGNTASYGLAIPIDTSYLGAQLYTQGLALDPGINALGAVATDAAAFIVGM